MSRLTGKAVTRAGLLAIAAVLVFSGAAHAQDARNALPVCHEYAKLGPADKRPSAIELFVVVDQTTPFSATLKQSLARQITPFLGPGNTLSVFAFSAFTQGFHTRRLLHARLDYPLEKAQRDDASKPLLERFDQCLTFQSKAVQQLAGDALREALGGDGASIAKSDVLASLRDISAQVKASTATRKIVLLASDMLENSSVSSFYVRNAVRKIDPQQELKLVKANELDSNFGGADIYVIGAGLIAEDAKAKGAYRDPQTLRMLQSFWQQYFKDGNANLKEFGTPDLLGDIR